MVYLEVASFTRINEKKTIDLIRGRIQKRKYVSFSLHNSSYLYNKIYQILGLYLNR